MIQKQLLKNNQNSFINSTIQELIRLYILQMDPESFIPTKQIPGLRTDLDPQTYNELKMLDPKRYQNIVPFFGGHPSSLVKKDENQLFTKPKKGKQSPFLLCQKTDGVRYLLIITNQDHFFISRQGKAKLVSYKAQCQMAKNWHINPSAEFKKIVHILDGQMIKDKIKNGEERLRYLIFDALVVFGKKIIEKPLKYRLQLCQKVMRCNQYLLTTTESAYKQGIQVKIKDFFRLTCSTYASTQIMQKRKLASQPTTMQFLQKFYIKALPHQNDGIIFNHEQKPYLLGLNSGYIKWKPAQYNTVDFLLIPNRKLQDQFEERVLDLYLGWKDSEMASIYRMMFYNFTIVTKSTFKELQSQFDEKYNAAYNQNPDLVLEDNFGIIAQCKYQKIQQGSEQAHLFKHLLSSTKTPKQIHNFIMRQQNEQKQLQVIRKIQGQPCTKFWQIFRIRTDKNLPNNHEVARKIQQSIKDDIKFQYLVRKNQELNDLVKMPL